jgi:hypothetical protein
MPFATDALIVRDKKMEAQVEAGNIGGVVHRTRLKRST